jgi:hypothetical protein
MEVMSLYFSGMHPPEPVWTLSRERSLAPAGVKLEASILQISEVLNTNLDT